MRREGDHAVLRAEIRTSPFLRADIHILPNMLGQKNALAFLCPWIRESTAIPGACPGGACGRLWSL